MNSISPKKLSEIAHDVADDVAFELGRPWRVEDLRKKARKACKTAMRRAACSGLPPKRAIELFRNLIYEQAARNMDRLPPDQSQPTPSQIEAALDTFSIEQWRSLAETFHLEEADCVISYVDRDDNRHRLIRRLGAEKWSAMLGATVRHATSLWLRENRSKLVPISDVYWAGFWREQAHHTNRLGKGHPAKGRSIAELGRTAR